MKILNNARGIISPLILVIIAVVIVLAAILFFKTPTDRQVIKQESPKITVPIMDN